MPLGTREDRSGAREGSPGRRPARRTADRAVHPVRRTGFPRTDGPGCGAPHQARRGLEVFADEKPVKTCPACLPEDIPEGASKCRYCGTDQLPVRVG